MQADEKTVNLHPLYESIFVGRVSENLIKHRVRAKYQPLPDGSNRLMTIQAFDKPLFRESGYELDTIRKDPPENFIPDEMDTMTSEDVREQYIHRAIRRAQINAFDLVMCNPDLDTFCTFTVSPEAANRELWDDCYHLMKVWLSNRVQRKGLKYVIVPEYHKDGKSIHFHGLLNSEALILERARSPTGMPIYRKGKAVYNLSDVDFGYNSAMKLSGENARDKVSKYVFKYMGKQMGTTIGGRYFLHGGNLQRPIYVYADELSEVLPDTPAKYDKECTVNGSIQYRELYYI